MDFLPLELLSEIANQKVLSNKDLTSFARVNHRFHDAACTRLYRSGELSYVGVTNKDIVKVNSYEKNGKFVRIIKLNLFSLPTSTISIPTAIFPFLTAFINLHRIHITDSASLDWSSFLHVLAIIITTHPYLKILEVQRTLISADGRSDISQPLSLIESHKSNKGTFAKLDVFILRLSKKDHPGLISRAALNNLISILLPSTRSARAFTYSSDSHESSDIDLKDPVTKRDYEAAAWEWDNLEELTLKLVPRLLPTGGADVIGTPNPNWSYYLSIQRDLRNVKRLAIKTGIDELLAQGSGIFIGGLDVMPQLTSLRISNTGRYLDWDTKHNPKHPFFTLAQRLPNLKYIEQTDSYYLTRAIQSLKVFRGEGHSVDFGYVVSDRPWISYDWEY
ncbi:hypothetical protein TWF730_007482 [Orbilia blumenaviensis]|uniref:F-box domain-containing protein n=1 Tax=Orbilia blumenaviensis TaxID=1796055 RepID=A0AAV9V9P5_9PEZI